MLSLTRDATCDNPFFWCIHKTACFLQYAMVCHYRPPDHVLCCVSISCHCSVNVLRKECNIHCARVVVEQPHLVGVMNVEIVMLPCLPFCTDAYILVYVATEPLA